MSFHFRKDLKNTLQTNGGFKNPFHDGRSRMSFQYSDGQRKIYGRNKDGSFKRNHHR